MRVKLIAVDMDGSFLNDLKIYNQKRFLEQYARMKQKGIRFVVASGNQYYQLLSFFLEISCEISFVAENGGWVVDAGKEVFKSNLSKKQFVMAATVLASIPQIEIIACGKNSAYTLNSYNDKFYKLASGYYHRLKKVNNFDILEEDTFFKFSLNVPGREILRIQKMLCKKLNNVMVPIITSDSSIDLITPGIHKGNGLRILQKKWGISDREVLAFGDNSNDIEMLRQAGFSFAMANAKPNIKAAARYEAPHNNKEGVLEVIEKALNGDAPFN